MSDSFVTTCNVARQAPLSMEFPMTLPVLEWVAISFSIRSSLPRDQTHVSCIVGRIFTAEALRKPV